MVIAPLTEDTEEGTTYGALQAVAGAIEATITPESADPDVQYADDHEFDTLYPDPEVTFSTSMADIPLAIQEMIFGNAIDDNGVLVRTSTDKPPYFAVGFMSEKANHKFRYVWLYKVRAKPMTETYKTKRARPSPVRPAPSSGRPSSAPPMDAIRPWPMRARTALMPPRPPLSSRASMNPRSRRRRTGRNSLLAPIPMMRGRSPFAVGGLFA